MMPTLNQVQIIAINFDEDSQFINVYPPFLTEGGNGRMNLSKRVNLKNIFNKDEMNSSQESTIKKTAKNGDKAIKDSAHRYNPLNEISEASGTASLVSNSLCFTSLDSKSELFPCIAMKY